MARREEKSTSWAVSKTYRGMIQHTTLPKNVPKQTGRKLFLSGNTQEIHLIKDGRKTESESQSPGIMFVFTF